jgi:hypothetical protein
MPAGQQQCSWPENSRIFSFKAVRDWMRWASLVGFRGGARSVKRVDSDEAARVFRACSAHRSDLMPPTIPI